MNTNIMQHKHVNVEKMSQTFNADIQNVEISIWDLFWSSLRPIATSCTNKPFVGDQFNTWNVALLYHNARQTYSTNSSTKTESKFVVSNISLNIHRVLLLGEVRNVLQCEPLMECFGLTAWKQIMFCRMMRIN